MHLNYLRTVYLKDRTLPVFFHPEFSSEEENTVANGCILVELKRQATFFVYTGISPLHLPQFIQFASKDRGIIIIIP